MCVVDKVYCLGNSKVTIHSAQGLVCMPYSDQQAWLVQCLREGDVRAKSLVEAVVSAVRGRSSNPGFVEHQTRGNG